MLKFAKITNNLVENVELFPDGTDLPDGYIDVSSIPCDIGWPIVDSVPDARPSQWHTLIDGNTGWELTPENEALKIAAETVSNNQQVLYNLINIGTQAMEYAMQLLNAKYCPTVESMTRSGSTVTVTVDAHCYKSGDVIKIAGANETDYNGDQEITVVSGTVFTFEIVETPDTPATGTITATDPFFPPELNALWAAFLAEKENLIEE